MAKGKSGVCNITQKLREMGGAENIVTAQLDLIATIPDAVAPQPEMWIVVSQYDGPGWFNGQWKVFGPFLSELAANTDTGKLSKWWKRKQIYKT